MSRKAFSNFPTDEEVFGKKKQQDQSSVEDKLDLADKQDINELSDSIDETKELLQDSQSKEAKDEKIEQLRKEQKQEDYNGRVESKLDELLKSQKQDEYQRELNSKLDNITTQVSDLPKKNSDSIQEHYSKNVQPQLEQLQEESKKSSGLIKKILWGSITMAGSAYLDKRFQISSRLFNKAKDILTGNGQGTGLQDAGKLGSKAVRAVSKGGHFVASGIEKAFSKLENISGERSMTGQMFHVGATTARAVKNIFKGTEHKTQDWDNKLDEAIETKRKQKPNYEQDREKELQKRKEAYEQERRTGAADDDILANFGKKITDLADRIADLTNDFAQGKKSDEKVVDRLFPSADGTKTSDKLKAKTAEIKQSATGFVDKTKGFLKDKLTDITNKLDNIETKTETIEKQQYKAEQKTEKVQQKTYDTDFYEKAEAEREKRKKTKTTDKTVKADNKEVLQAIKASEQRILKAVNDNADDLLDDVADVAGIADYLDGDGDKKNKAPKKRRRKRTTRTPQPKSVGGKKSSFKNMLDFFKNPKASFGKVLTGGAGGGILGNLLTKGRGIASLAASAPGMLGGLARFGMGSIGAGAAIGATFAGAARFAGPAAAIGAVGYGGFKALGGAINPEQYGYGNSAGDRLMAAGQGATRAMADVADTVTFGIFNFGEDYDKYLERRKAMSDDEKVAELNNYINKLNEILQRDEKQLQDYRAYVKHFGGKTRDDIQRLLLQYGQETGLIKQAAQEVKTGKQQPLVQKLIAQDYLKEQQKNEKAKTEQPQEQKAENKPNIFDVAKSKVAEMTSAIFDTKPKTEQATTEKTKQEQKPIVQDIQQVASEPHDVSDTGQFIKELTEKNSNLKYKMGGGRNSKGLGSLAAAQKQGGTDCSAWVSLVNQENWDNMTIDGKKLTDDQKSTLKKTFLSSTIASNIVQKVSKSAGLKFEGSAKDIKTSDLSNMDIIGEDNGSKGFDSGRWNGIDHIVQVIVGNDGKKYVTQSDGKNGVNLKTIDEYLKIKKSKGTTLYVTSMTAAMNNTLAQNVAKETQQNTPDIGQTLQDTFVQTVATPKQTSQDTAVANNATFTPKAAKQDIPVPNVATLPTVQPTIDTSNLATKTDILSMQKPIVQPAPAPTPKGLDTSNIYYQDYNANNFAMLALASGLQRG